MPTRAERQGRNESLFREVNERIAELNQTFHVEGRSEFLCECSDPDCAETLSLSLREYEIIRAAPNLFIVQNGHEHPDVDRVVRASDGFTLVEKTMHADLVRSWGRKAPRGG